MKEVIIPALLLLGMAALFGVLLSVLGKKLAVKRDERIDKVVAKLGGANCGACGFAGCDALATALVEGKATVSACPVASKENKEEIARILGTASSGEETVMVVACCGGVHCKDKYSYQGYGDCRSMELLSGGRKACPVGCMGMGSCVDACKYASCEVGQQGFSEIDHKKCITCGMCAKACPKGLIRRIPKSAKVYVACSNKGRGKEVSSVCSAGCIGCGLCAKLCPSGAITMVDNLPVFDYTKCTGCMLCVSKCPTKVIKTL